MIYNGVIINKIITLRRLHINKHIDAAEQIGTIIDTYNSIQIL